MRKFSDCTHYKIHQFQPESMDTLKKRARSFDRNLHDTKHHQNDSILMGIRKTMKGMKRLFSNSENSINMTSSITNLAKPVSRNRIKNLSSSTENTWACQRLSPSETRRRKSLPAKSLNSDCYFSDRYAISSTISPNEKQRNNFSVNTVQPSTDNTNTDSELTSSRGRKVSWADLVDLPKSSDASWFPKEYLQQHQPQYESKQPLSGKISPLLNSTIGNHPTEEITTITKFDVNLVNNADVITNKSYENDDDDLNTTQLQFDNKAGHIDEDVIELTEQLMLYAKTENRFSSMKSSSRTTGQQSQKYIYFVETNRKNFDVNKRNLLSKQLSLKGIKVDSNNNNNTNNNDECMPDRNMLGNSIVKKPYAIDDLYIKSNPKQNITENIFDSDYLQRCLSVGPQKANPFKQVQLQIPEKQKQVNNNTPKEHVSIDEIHSMVEEILHRKLDDKTFDEKLVTTWCKEISNLVRDQMKILTNNERKVVATTYIGPKSKDGGAHVAVKCQKQMNTDDFITVALEGADLFVWVSLLMAKY